MRARMKLFKWFFQSKSKDSFPPDQMRFESVWMNGFSSGFDKAWDVMAPIMVDSIKKAENKIRSKAIDDTLGNLESTIISRIEKSGLVDLKSANSVLSKRKEFEVKLIQSKTEASKQKYNNYIEVIDWILNGDLLSKT